MVTCNVNLKGAQMSESQAVPNKNPEQLPYHDIETLLGMIEGSNGDACRRIHEDYRDKFEAGLGSSHNHQFWPGGYVDHVTEAMNIGLLLHKSFGVQRPLTFPASDILLVVYLHDLEKPFKYFIHDDGQLYRRNDLLQKDADEAFKREIIERYGITLTNTQENALEFVEGIRDHKYQKSRRVMGELAVLCHMADLASARLWYNHPLAENDPWSGSKRQNPAARDITLPSEF